jgi:hypothetical protein
MTRLKKTIFHPYHDFSFAFIGISIAGATFAENDYDVSCSAGKTFFNGLNKNGNTKTGKLL